jgi:uncharacterized protein with HEPN domain/predicted nucleotidyltransferase
MDRQEVLDTLRRHKPILEERFGVTELALFGSFARDQATEESDVDILVKFNAPATSKAYFGAQFYLEDLLGRAVDLSTIKTLRPEILPYVERDITMPDDEELIREWRFYIKDMIEFGEKVLDFTAGIDEAAFIDDDLTYYATVHSIQLIGEAARHIPQVVKEAYPDIPWHDIIGTRNRIVHGYDVIDQDVIWKIVQNDIPALLPQLQKLLGDVQRQQLWSYPRVFLRTKAASRSNALAMFSAELA